MDPMADKCGRIERTTLGITMMVIPAVLVIVLYGIWPVPVGGAANADASYPAVLGLAWTPTLEQRLMLIVLISGALGSYIHAATSFATYVGNGELHRTWLWWYVLRPFVGAALAFVLYAVTRGGLLTGSGNASVLNPFGIAAIAAMAGMFSKQAVDKLREVFDNLFRTAKGQGDDQRGGKLAPLASPPPLLPTGDKAAQAQIDVLAPASASLAPAAEPAATGATQ
jgi:hypothetical protein